MTIGIYCYTSCASGKSYVGQSWNIENRYGHDGRGASCVFHNAINKYGWYDFECVIIEELGEDVAQEELDDTEEFWIQYLGTRVPAGYNLRMGGSHGQHSESSKKKMREAKLGKKRPTFSKQWCENMSRSMRGKKHNDETKKKIAAKLKGNQHTKGYRLSQEHKRKIGDKHRGKVVSLETRQKLREKVLGRKHSLETRQKMSESHKGQVPWNKGKKKDCAQNDT